MRYGRAVKESKSVKSSFTEKVTMENRFGKTVPIHVSCDIQDFISLHIVLTKCFAFGAANLRETANRHLR